MEGAQGWLGGRLAKLQTALGAAEERIFGVGDIASPSGERDARGYPAVRDNVSSPSRRSGGPGRLSAFLEPRSELEERLLALLLRIDGRKEVSEKWFSGDMVVHRIFTVLHSRMREMGTLCLRGSEERCALANQMLVPELSLREAPRYSIHFEPDTSKEVVYFKQLYSGWCCKLDKATFEAFAYGGVELPEKAYENLHSLIARGPVLQKGLFPATVRVTLWVACDNDTHLARQKDLAESKREHEQRIEQNSQRIGVAASVPEPPEVAVIADMALLESDIFFAAGAPTGRTTERPKVIYTCSEMEMTECIEHVLEAVSDNLDRLSEALDIALATASFTEKVEYWSALKGSDATSQKLLCALFDAALDSGAAGTHPAGFEGARELCEQYRRNYPKLPQEELSLKLVQWQASLNVSTGFVTGFGGFLTMPITIPTGMIATWVTSARLSFAVAHVYGHDIFHPCVADAVLWCLTGSAEAEGESTPEETLRSRLGACRQNRGYIAEESPMALELSVASAESESAASEDPGEPAQDLANYDPSSTDFQEKYTTLYDLLGVEQTATQQEVRLAYRRLALRYHPDKLCTSDPEQVRIATQRFQVLGAAYEELGDPERRKAYDATLREGTWSWSSFAWDNGVKRARDAFVTAQKCAADAFQARHHNIGGHASSRAITQAVVEVVEVTTVQSLARAGTQAEIRSSIMAGERLVTRATASTTSKLIPIIGALVCGAIDGATTASVGRCAMRVFKV